MRVVTEWWIHIFFWCWIDILFWICWYSFPNHLNAWHLAYLCENFQFGLKCIFVRYVEIYCCWRRRIEEWDSAAQSVLTFITWRVFTQVRQKSRRSKLMMFLVVMMHGKMLIELKHAVHNVQTMKHISCKFKFVVLMNLPQHFTVVANAQNNGVIISWRNGEMFCCFAMLIVPLILYILLLGAVYIWRFLCCQLELIHFLHLAINSNLIDFQLMMCRWFHMIWNRVTSSTISLLYNPSLSESVIIVQLKNEN